MPQSDLVIRGRRVVFQGAVTPASVHINAGRISAITPYEEEVSSGVKIVEAADSFVMPGLVDSHVHVNEPGRTEWEGFETATRAAAAGGVTTLCDMPLNSLPPTVTTQALQVKRAAAAGRCAVDVAFWGGAVPGSQPELRGLHEAVVFGFSCFRHDSGVPKDPPLDGAGLRAAMAEAGQAGSVQASHAQDPR